MQRNYGKFAIFVITLGAITILAQEMPSELMREYEDYIDEAKARGRTPDTQTPKYETPSIFEEVDTALFEKVTREEPVKAADKEERAYFNEYIVVNNDTVQVLTKATPRKLDFFGADLFAGDIVKTIPEAPMPSSYVIGQGDNILLNLWGSVDYQYNLTVDREGKVFIPKAGTVTIAGYSLDRASDVIINALSGIYTDFEVDISIAKIRGISVFIVGEVEEPGVYAIPGLSRAIDALAIAGGPNEYGSYRKINIYRRGKLAANLDIYEFILKGKTSSNIQLVNGDVITVPRLGPKVKVRGLVRRPAIYEIEDSTTIGDVIELAGGVLPEANISSIMIDGISGCEHQIHTFDLGDSSETARMASDGDDFSIFPIEKYRSEIVFLKGQVVQSGPHGLYDSMRVSDLLNYGDQLLPDAYTKRGDLIRTLSDRRKSIYRVMIDSALAFPGSKYDVFLKNEDELVIYSIWDIEEKREVTISGAVRKPAAYEYFTNMRVSDLIFESGGVLESAYLRQAELARVNPGAMSEIIYLDLEEILNNPGGADDLLLEPYDAVFIREIPGWKLQDVVVITGELEFPGKYALHKNKERLSDLIERAGGFTDDAFLPGVVFLRPKLALDIENKNLISIVQQTQEAILDTSGAIIRPPLLFKYSGDQLARIIIDIEKVTKGLPEDDIVLESGDSIHVPKTPTGVTVVGMVASSGTIHWVPKKNVNYYIERAGGYTRNADKSGIRLVRANGKVEKVSSKFSKVAPGDVIIIPQRIKKQTDLFSIVEQTVSILSGMATTIYILFRL